MSFTINDIMDNNCRESFDLNPRVVQKHVFLSKITAGWLPADPRLFCNADLFSTLRSKVI